MRITGMAVCAALAVAALGCSAAAQADDAAVRSQLKQTLEQRFPLKIDVVQPAPFPGMYEVIAGEQVAYADPSGDYLIVGRLMDTRTRHDLSAEHLDARGSIDFHALPLKEAIKIVRGNGERQLAVFADPDCPYCQKLEKDLQTVTDITVYVFLFPLETAHPSATAHAHAIWCARDRSAAWSDWVIGRKAPAAASEPCAADPIGAIQTLAASLRVNATPTLFLENGQRIGGYVPLEQLKERLAQAAGTSATAVQRDERAPPAPLGASRAP